MTNVPHILAIPERQASASARRVLAAHLGPRAAQRRQEPSAGAGLRTDECELWSLLPQGTFSMALLLHCLISTEML